MPTFTISTSKGTFQVEANRQPTPEEAEQLVASQDLGADRMNAAARVKNESTMKLARGIGLELGGSVVGGLMGSVLGPVGTYLGAAAGGAAGNYLKQLAEVSEGSSKEISMGKVAASGVSGLAGGTAGNVAKAATGFARPMLARAAQGGLVAASAEVVEKAIDEGRLPTWQEVRAPIAIGSIAGGALGAVERRYATNGSLITNNALAQATQGATGLGVAAYVYNDAQEQGEKDPFVKAALYGLGAYGATHIPSLAQRINKDRARLVVAGPEQVAKKEVVLQVMEMQNKLKATEDQAARIGNWINKEIASSSDPAAMTAKVLSVMDGRANKTILSSDMQTYMDEFFRLRDENTDAILQLYPHLAPDLRKAIDNNRASYIRTAYAAHDPKAKRYVDFDVPADRQAYRDELITGITKDGVAKAEAEKQADAIMARMLDDVAYVGSGSIPGGGAGIASSALMSKGDLSDAGRKWLGEVMDPGRRVTQTLKAQSRLVITEEHDRQLAQFLKTSGIGLDAPPAAGGYVRLVEGDAPVLHRSLKDLYVPQVWADAYKEILSPNLIGDGAVARNWMAVGSFSKAMKTVGNLAEAIAPQVVGNLALAASSFKANPINLIDGARKTLFDLGWRGGQLGADARIKLAREMRELKSLGIMRGGADVQELETFLKMSAKENKGAQLLEKFSKVYGFPDTAVRYGIYKSNLDELKSFQPGKVFSKAEEMELKKEAARLTNDQFPTYELIPRRYRQASALTVANAFGAFEFEVMRTTVNQARYAAKLLASGNPEMVKAGAARALSMASVAAATAGLAVWGSRALGTDEETAKRVNNLLPSFDRNKANIIGLTKDGNITFTPVNYLAPYANAMAALNEGLNGRNPLPYMKTMFIGDDLGPLATPAVEFITNTYYGTKVPITERRDDVALLERFVTRAFMPQFVTGTLSRVEKAARGEVSKLGAVYNFEDSTKRLFGYRAQTYDPLKLAEARIRDAITPMMGDLAGYRRILKDKVNNETGAYNDIDEESIYRSRAAGYAEGQKALSQIFMDLQAIGQKTGRFGDKEIVKAFREAGVPARLIASAAFGHTSEMPRGLERSPTEIVEELMSDPAKRKNALSTLMAQASNDPFKARRLQDTWKEYIKAEAKGNDPYVSILGGLGVADGERAKAIDSIMVNYAKQPGGAQVAEKLRNKLLTAGVITPEVYYQMLEINQKRRMGP
jgi:hypothetical protein